MSKYKIRYLIPILMLPVFAAQAQTIKTVNLEKAVEYGLKNHTDILNQEKNLELKGWQTKEAGSKFFPSIKATSDYRYNTKLPVTILPGDIFGQSSTDPIEVQMGTKNAFQAGIQVDQPIYNPLLSSDVKEKKIQEEIAQVNVNDTKVQVANKIKGAYFQAVLNYEALRTSQKNLAVYDTLVNVLTHRLNDGLATEQQLTEITEKQKNQKLENDLSQLKFRNSIDRLKMAMDFPQDSILQIADTTVLGLIGNINYAKNPDFSLQQIPQFNELTLEQKLNSERILSVKKEYLPDLSGYFFVGTQYYDKLFRPFTNTNRWYNQSYIGLRLSLPVFGGFERYRRQKAFEVNRDLLAEKKRKLAADLKTKEKILSDEILISLKEAYKAKNDYNFSSEQLTKQVQQFENGLSSYEKVLRMQLEMMLQYSTYINSLSNALNSQLQYEKLIASY